MTTDDQDLPARQQASGGDASNRRSTDSSVYVSVDVETDGPIPGPHSMLSFGAAAFKDGRQLATFTRNLECLPDAAGAPDTMAWWKTQPQAWDACRSDPEPPQRAMVAFVEWVEKLPGKPVFVAYPAGFDFLFMYWYMIRFAGRSPFSFSALDLKSYAAALLRIPYRDATKRAFPKRWFGPGRHNHVALDDAIEQGEMFMRMLADGRSATLLAALDSTREERDAERKEEAAWREIYEQEHARFLRAWERAEKAEAQVAAGQVEAAQIRRNYLHEKAEREKAEAGRDGWKRQAEMVEMHLIHEQALHVETELRTSTPGRVPCGRPGCTDTASVRHAECYNHRNELPHQLEEARGVLASLRTEEGRAAFAILNGCPLPEEMAAERGAREAAEAQIATYREALRLAADHIACDDDCPGDGACNCGSHPAYLSAVALLSSASPTEQQQEEQ